MKDLRQQSLIKYTAHQFVEMLQQKKKLQSAIRLQELVEELARLGNAKHAIKIFPSITTNLFAAGA
jgi:hypothetical protein